MNKYLQLLLQLENTVIIPSFGAIVLANEKTGDLIFNEYLKFNDGKLVDFIVEKSNMDEQEALNFIAKYVREINAQLDKGESYDMFGFGSFTKNKDRKIVFVSWDKMKDVGPAGVQNIVEEEEEQSQEKHTEDNRPVIEEEKVNTPVEEEKESTTEEQKEEKKVNSYVPPIEEETKKEEAQQTESVSPIINEPKKEVKDDTEEEEIEDTPIQPIPRKKKKRWGLIVILLLIVGVGAIAALNLEKIESYISNDDKTANLEKVDIEQQKADIADSISRLEANQKAIEDSLAMISALNDSLDTQSDTTQITESPIETEIDNTINEEDIEEAPQVNTSSTSGDYKMISGNFSSLENAEKQVAELRAKGFNAEIIGQFGGLHRVSMNSYSSFQEAVDAIPSAKEEIPGAYVSHQ